MVKRGRASFTSTYARSAAKVARRSMPYVSSAINAAMPAAVKTLTKVLVGGNEGPSSAVSTQHDSKMLYKRKRAPLKVRRRAARRYKNFLSNQLRLQTYWYRLITTVK